MTTNAPGMNPPTAPGMPTWADVATPDLAGTRAFYTGLFGWTGVEAEEPEAGGYTTFYLDGKAVAGAGPIMSEGQPPVWTTYMATDDIDETSDLVEKAGGRILMGPMDVLKYGRMGVYLDPAGAAFAAWQAGEHRGAEVIREPGAMAWNELMTRDPEGAKTFYGEVFHWDAEEVPMDPVTYTMWKLGDQQIGGMMPMMGDDWPADLPPHWMVYFAVDDADAIAQRAAELGGVVSITPTDMQAGRFAVLNDPYGSFFSIIAVAPDMQM